MYLFYVMNSYSHRKMSLNKNKEVNVSFLMEFKLKCAWAKINAVEYKGI